MSDADDLARAVKDAVANERPYASFFEASDREIGEWGVAQTFIERATREPGFPFRNLKRRGRGNDPPDCEAVDNSGRAIAIEVTELVDSGALAAARHGRHEWALWDDEKVRVEIQKRLTAKDDKRLIGGPYDEYIVLIHTDEPGLSADLAERSVTGHRFSVPARIQRAFLLLSYDPKLKSYPYLRLPFSSAV